MGITLSKRVVAAVAGAAIAAGVQALAPRAGAAGTAAVAAGPEPAVAVAQDAVGPAGQAAAVRYWTPGRIWAALEAANDGGPTAADTAAKPRKLVAAPGRRLRRLVRKAPPAPSARGPWLTGDTAGDGLRWTRAGAAAAAVGKVFFTLGGQDYVCSGTLVGGADPGGADPDVVLTAAHCVTNGDIADRAMRWATNWMFIPEFSDGQFPYGEYTARRFFADPDWTGPQGGREQYDVAFVQVTAATADGSGGPALSGAAGRAARPRGLPVQFASSQDTLPAPRTYVFGYPAEPPYSGQDLNFCAGRTAAAGGSVFTACAMTAGDSGGPWLAGFSPASGSGRVVAVTTYKLSDNLRVLYGAVLGPQARALYQQAVKSAG
jgi:V8-like Glu-specific endopeptidase